MCGIAGAFSRSTERGNPPSEAEIVAMLSALAHRGPDAVEHRALEAGVLGCARLAIVDPAGSKQPMASDDDRFFICFNGELFNYRDLRAELVQEGVRFGSDGDTEVALRSLIHRGPPALARFRGQFALAFYDRCANRLLLARDRFGILPLHYRVDEREVAFASELKAIQAVGRFRSSHISPIDLIDLFVLWGLLPGRSLLEGTATVPPGHYVEFTPSQVIERPYWSPRFEGTATGTPDEVEARLESSVVRRLSDRLPVGVLLSGGLDSSAVLALAARAQSGVASFGLAFADERFSEVDAQRQVADALGVQHFVVGVDDQALAFSLRDAVRAIESPLARAAPVATFLLAKEIAARGFRVVLTGEGADELFLGYDIHKTARAWELRSEGQDVPDGWLRAGELPMPARATFAPTEANTNLPAGFRAHFERWQAGRRLGQYLHEDIRPLFERRIADYPRITREFVERVGATEPLRQAQLLELLLFLPTSLLGSQADRPLMAHSIEGRFPFLDEDLADYTFRVPVSSLAPRLEEKEILRAAVSKRIPPAVVARRKYAFNAPTRSLLRHLSAGDTFDLIESRALPFDAAKLHWLRKRAASDAEIGGEDLRVLLFAVTTAMLCQDLVL